VNVCEPELNSTFGPVQVLEPVNLKPNGTFGPVQVLTLSEPEPDRTEPRQPYFEPPFIKFVWQTPI
jgi:hypothetical protein